MLRRLDHLLDLYEYTEFSGGPPAPTDNPFNPYAFWWTRRRALVPAYLEAVRGQLRDFLFGDRPGEFGSLFFQRGLLAPVGRPDTDFLRRWLLRDPASDSSWIVDFAPRIYDPPLPHIHCYAQSLTPSPVNRD